MSRWVAITADHLKAAGHAAIVEQASSMAVGAIDPAEEAIADATARVRRAVAAGNTLDADTGKIPVSLKGLAIRLALFALMERIGLSLSEDQKDSRRDDQSDLKRLADNRTRVEAPDDPAGSGEMQEPGRGAAAINVPRRQTGRGRTSGL